MIDQVRVGDVEDDNASGPHVSVADKGGRGARAAQSGSRSFTVSVSEDFHSLPDVWPSLTEPGDAICFPFQCRDVIATWASTIGWARNAKAAMVVVRESHGEQRPLMLLPFCVESRRGVRVLRFVDGEISDYNAPVLFPWTPDWDATAFVGVWRQILKALPQVDLIALEKMPETVLGRRNPLALLDTSDWECACHAAQLGGSWAEFAAERTSPPKRYLRYQRSLQRSTDVVYSAVKAVEDPAATQEALDHLFRQKQRRFEETRVPGFEAGDGRKDFYTAMTMSPLTGGNVHLSVLKADSDVLGTQWGIVFGDRYYYLICGNEVGEWAKYSTGRMVNEAMLEWCHDQGLAVADFGIGDEAYKFEFCDLHTPLFAYVSAQSVKGKAALAGGRFVEAVRGTALYQKLRPYKWVALRAFRR